MPGPVSYLEQNLELLFGRVHVALVGIQGIHLHHETIGLRPISMDVTWKLSFNTVGASCHEGASRNITNFA